MGLQRVVRSSIIDAPIDRVWSILRDFNSHDQWHEGWNGVSAGMWETKEWSDYLSNNGFPEEASKVSKSENISVLDFL